MCGFQGGIFLPFSDCNALPSSPRHRILPLPPFLPPSHLDFPLLSSYPRTGGCHYTHLGLRISLHERTKWASDGRPRISQTVSSGTLEFGSVSLGVQNLDYNPHPRAAGLTPWQTSIFPKQFVIRPCASHGRLAEISNHGRRVQIADGYRFRPISPLHFLLNRLPPAGHTEPGWQYCEL